MTDARLAANGFTAQNALKKTSLPIICKVLLPTLFPGFTLLSGPKHSNTIPSIVELAVTFSDDENEVTFVPFTTPTTVHVKLKVSLEHVGGAALNCPATHPKWETVNHSDVCIKQDIVYT